MSLSAYSEYKPSDAAWLGDIPKHWSLESLRGQFEELKDKNVGALDQNYLSLVAGRGVMPYAEKGEMGNKKPDDLEKCKLVKAGNFVINSMNFGIGAFGVSAHDGVCSPVYVVLEPSEPRSLRYLRWIFDNPGFREVAQSFGNGILAHRAAIGWDDLKLMKIGVPPIEEQEAIATFLDRETAKIDALVTEQERLIALLKEKRQAVISHAVTKGLDPDAPMKDSGIEWLGEIPAHWEVGKLFYGARLQSGYAFSSGDFGSEGVPVVRMNNLDRGKLDLSEAVRISDAVCNPAVALCPGDLVWGMSGSIGETGSLGNFAVVVEHDIPCQLNQRVGRFLINKNRMAPEFLQIWIQSQPFYLQIMLAVTGTAQFNVSAEQVQSTMAAFPPLDEQQLINEYITGECLRFASIIDEAQAAITLLQERRAALISAAVTGKIDVRGLVDQHEMETA